MKKKKKVEKVQRAGTRWVSSLRDISYEERLKKLQLPTLTCRKKRNLRGDMIMLYKCVDGIEKIDVNEYVISGQSSSRGHSKKLYKKRLKKRY